MHVIPGNLPAVVVIEDDLYMQGILSQCLSENFSPVLFDNGMDAFAYLQEGNIPDIIISDLNTPLLNGIQFLEQVRSSGFFGSIPVIILSGVENTDTKIKCLEAGADDFIVKPFNPRELAARLKMILKRAGKLTVN
ncbi:response regulator transcription factor [Panacibacter ginsenosidivorans]|uniref:Response regulator transcription factor n=1 Tax=Panacibacter ginsenosidivorans TaxID=1813871 RepID=A0A5B8V6B2_9BACT|nr:response regulator transcription factor [Panacibacter ginsenosidivorans]QEC66645.1 response regulator transcription factor [Panacibacter ginsenosidivorans]